MRKAAPGSFLPIPVSMTNFDACRPWFVYPKGNLLIGSRTQWARVVSAACCPSHENVIDVETEGLEKVFEDGQDCNSRLSVLSAHLRTTPHLEVVTEVALCAVNRAERPQLASHEVLQRHECIEIDVGIIVRARKAQIHMARLPGPPGLEGLNCANGIVLMMIESLRISRPIIIAEAP